MANIRARVSHNTKPVTAENVTAKSFAALTSSTMTTRTAYRRRFRAVMTAAHCHWFDVDKEYTVLSSDGKGKLDVLGTVTYDDHTGKATFALGVTKGYMSDNEGDA